MSDALDQAFAEAKRLPEREQDVLASEIMEIIRRQREARRLALLDRIEKDGRKYVGVSEAIDSASSEFRRGFTFGPDQT